MHTPRLKGEPSNALCAQASASVLDCDLVLAPVHLSMHWTCVAVNLRDQEIVYLDSMGVRPNPPRTPQC